MPFDNCEIRASKGYSVYSFDSDRFSHVIEKFLPASVEELKRYINERVTGSPDGDGFYQCSAENIAECLIIIADFASD